MLNKNEILKKLIQEYDVKTTRDVQEMLIDITYRRVEKCIYQLLSPITIRGYYIS